MDDAGRSLMGTNAPFFDRFRQRPGCVVLRFFGGASGPVLLTPAHGFIVAAGHPVAMTTAAKTVLGLTPILKT